MLFFGVLFIQNLRRSLVTGLFPGKSAAFEKAKGQGPGVFRLLGFRFLSYERPPEKLK